MFWNWTKMWWWRISHFARMWCNSNQTEADRFMWCRTGRMSGAVSPLLLYSCVVLCSHVQLWELRFSGAVEIWIVVFWHMTPCGLVGGNRHFGGTYSVCLQGRIIEKLQHHTTSEPNGPQSKCAGWASHPVWTPWWWREILLCQESNPGRSAPSLVSVLTELYRIPRAH
jgi:hypothetical protein